jgi:hypothetical protein
VEPLERAKGIAALHCTTAHVPDGLQSIERLLNPIKGLHFVEPTKINWDTGWGRPDRRRTGCTSPLLPQISLKSCSLA